LIDYTQDFSIQVYDAGSGGGTNPFGDDTIPLYWAMDGKGGVYVKITSDSWQAWNEYGDPEKSGTYELIGGIAAQWTVTGGNNIGDTGLAIIETGQIRVANFINENSDMNGTFTKLKTTLTGEGTWISSEPIFNGYYVKIVVDSGGAAFVESVSLDGSSGWTEVVQGTSAITNPAACTITKVNGILVGSSSSWVAWSTLTPSQKIAVGVPGTFTVIVYDDPADKLETLGYTFDKQ
jgi:hypothetical protein